MDANKEKKLGYEYEEGARYVAYVSSYTKSREHKYGIRIYDVDMENGYLKEKKQVEITNSSYVSISHNRKYLYSITDEGVESYKILKGDVDVLTVDDPRRALQIPPDIVAAGVERNPR